MNDDHEMENVECVKSNDDHGISNVYVLSVNDAEIMNVFALNNLKYTSNFIVKYSKCTKAVQTMKY